MSKIVNCDYCGKEYQKSFYKSKAYLKHNYCCKKCSDFARIKRVIINCIECKKSFETTPYKATFKQYCSHKCHINSRKGKSRSPEICNKISLGRKGIKFSEQHIKNLSISHKGKCGTQHPKWKGGSINIGGYIYLNRMNCNSRKTSEMYIKRARYVMEQHIGRCLNSNEIIHHINKNTLDDRIENLAVLSRSEHAKIHALHI
jgi:hypothetical protein